MNLGPKTTVTYNPYRADLPTYKTVIPKEGTPLLRQLLTGLKNTKYSVQETTFFKTEDVDELLKAIDTNVLNNLDKGKAINNLKSLQRDFIQDLGTGDLGKIDRSYKTHVNTMTNLSALQEGGPDEGYHEFYTPGINNPYAVFDASQGFHESGELMEFKGGAWWKAEDAQAYY